MYFDHCATAQDIKREYHRLAMRHHPDRGGDNATMAAINAEYAQAHARALRNEKPHFSETQHRQACAIAEEVRAAIEAIINLPNLDIEICGLWVWVGGETRSVRQILKEAGYHWAPVKKKWYFAGVPSRGRGNYTMDDIRFTYGTQTVKGQPRQDAEDD